MLKIREINLKEISSRTTFNQHGEINIKGLGPFGKVMELFAKQFLGAGVKRVSRSIVKSTGISDHFSIPSDLKLIKTSNLLSLFQSITIMEDLLQKQKCCGLMDNDPFHRYDLNQCTIRKGNFHKDKSANHSNIVAKVQKMTRKL